MKRPFKKLTAWLCCMAMLISFIPATALPVFATETEPVELTQELAANALASGEYYLSGDLALTGGLTFAKNAQVTIDLAGNDITGTVYPLITVSSGKVTLTDSTADGTPGTDYVSGTITGGENASDANYGMITVNGGEFVLEGGKLTDYKHTGKESRGGAVTVMGDAGAVFTMDGGMITNNSAIYGGGVYVTNSATFTMNGGLITGNTATKTGAGGGGGVCGAMTSVININNGTITGNFADRGNEIALADSAKNTLNINGGTIVSTESGTYKCVYSHTGTFNIAGGTIGRAYLRFGSMTVSGGNITELRADANATTPYSVEITGNPVIGGLLLGDTTAGNKLTIGKLTEGASVTTVNENPVLTMDNTVVKTGKVYTYTVPTLPYQGALYSGEYVLSGDHVLTNTLTIPAGVEVSIDLAGNTISMPAEKDAVYFVVNGKLTIKDSVGGGKVQFKDTAGGYGGINIYGTFVLESGELNGWTRLTGAKAGGMLNMWAGSTFTMTGGKITGADCASDTVIRSQTAGDITVTITGGEITGNNTNSNILGVTGTASAPATVTIGGTANISGNTISGAAFTPANHELLFTNAHVTVSGTATVGTLYTNGDAQAEGVEGYPYSSMTFTGAPTVQSVRWSTSANTPVRIEGLTEGAEIKVVGLLGGGQIDGTVAVSEPDTVSGYTMYTYTYEDPNKGNLPTSGEVEAGIYTLTENVALEGTLIVKGEVIIDLNGKNITGTVYPLIQTQGSGANLIIKDSAADGTPGVDYVSGAIKGGENTNGGNYGMIYVAGGTFTLESGKLTGYNQTTSGGNRGTVGVLNSTFNMTGGEISGNTVAKGGGGVLVSSSVFNMSGGAICNNTAATNGGGVVLEGTGTFTMTDGIITGNTAAKGGGVYTGSTKADSVTISGGTISDNTATGTDSTSGGGGLYVNNGASATVSGTAVISENTATTYGGAIHNAGVVTITGGTIQNNSATKYGGALYLANYANNKLTGITATVTGGTITGNSATRGGAISTYEGGGAGEEYLVKLTIGGTAVIEGNEAASGGANLYLQPADLTITGGTIGTGTKAGAVVAKSSSDNTWIRNNAENTTTVTGGNINGLYMDKGTVNVSGNPVIGEINVTNTTINMSDLTSGAKIHTADVGKVTVGDETVYTTNDRDYLCADDVYDVTVEQVAGGTITVSPTAGIAGTKVTVTVEVNDGYQLTGILLDGNVMEGTSFTISKDHTVTATFAEVEAGTIPTSGPIAAGEYELAEGVTLEGTLIVKGEVIIDLAGNTLTGAVAPYFEVQTGGKLIITDSSEGETGEIEGLAQSENSMIYINGGDFELQAGTLTGHTSTVQYGGAVGVKDGGKGSVTISGGTITGNTARRGGGISMGDGGTNVVLTITGGTITGNTATVYGLGDIYGHGGGAKTGINNISGGTIGGATLRYSTTNVTGAPHIDLLDCTDNALASTIGDLDADAYVVTKEPDALTVAEDGTVFHEPISSFYRHVDGEGEETSILVIGNSFGNDTINYLKKIAAKYDLLVGASNMYIGSQNFRWHAQSLAESLRDEDLNGDGTIGDSRFGKYDATIDANGDGKANEYQEGLYTVNGYAGYKTFPDVLDTSLNGNKTWDIVVLQNGVEYVGFEGTYNNDVQFLIDYINDVQPGAQIYFNQTWATDDSTTSGKNYMAQFGGSQEAMYNAILRNTEEFTTGRFAEQVAGYFPIGNAIQNMRDVYATTALTRDGYHLSLNAGRMIAGLTVMKTLFGIDLSELNAENMATMFDCGVGTETTSSTDAFDYNVEANVDALLAAVADACATPDEPTDGKNASIKQFNPDAVMNGSDEYVAVYENVTEVGNAPVRDDVKDKDGNVLVNDGIKHEDVLKDNYATAGAGKIVLYKNGTAVGSIDEQWLDAQINDFDLTNRLQKIKAKEEYYIIADPQAPQLAVAGGKLVMTFNLMLYTDNGVVENGGVYFTTFTEGTGWSAPVKVSDVMGYGLTTLVSGDLMMSVIGEEEIVVEGKTQKMPTTEVLTLTAAGVRGNQVKLADGRAEVAFAEVGGNIYALSSAGILYVSANGGETWTATEVANGVGASPDLVSVGSTRTPALYATWEDNSNNVYGKVWTVNATADDCGWSSGVESVVATSGASVYLGMQSTAQPSLVAVSGGAKLYFADSGELDTQTEKVASGFGLIADLGETLALKFFVLPTQFGTTKAELLNGTSGYKAVFAHYNAEGEEINTETSAEWEDHGSYVKISYSGLDARQLGDTITMRIVDSNDKQVSVRWSGSLKQYVDEQLGKSSTSSELVTMLIDLLNYGAAAQMNFGYNTDNLVNAGIDQSKATAERTLVDNKKDGKDPETMISLSVSLTERIDVNVYYLESSLKVSEEDITRATVSYKLKDGTVVTRDAVIDKDAKLGSNACCKVQFNKLEFAYVMAELTFKLYTGETEAEKATVTINVEDYCAEVVNNSTGKYTQELKELCKKIVSLGDSATAYFAK